MELKTERLVIRRIVEDDWRAIRDIWQDFNMSPYAQYDMPHCTEDNDVRTRIEKWASAVSSTEHMFFAVCLGRTFIGYVVFHIRENGYETGYCFHSRYQGKGYAKEATSALLNYLSKLGVTRITAGTALDNAPSVRLLESLGFALIEREKVSFYKDDDGNDIVFEGGIFELVLNKMQK